MTNLPRALHSSALISFGNSLCYTLCLSEIYRTALNPTISILHQPGARRFSLALDLAEIFKPVLVDRIIWKLINDGQISERDFEGSLNFCYLKESGRRKFIDVWDTKLRATFEHRSLKNGFPIAIWCDLNATSGNAISSRVHPTNRSKPRGDNIQREVKRCT